MISSFHSISQGFQRDSVKSWILRGTSVSLVFALIGLTLAVFLDAKLIAMAGGQPGTCGADCAGVIQSAYGRVFGVPVGLIGMFVHVSLAFCLMKRNNSFAHRAAEVLSGVVTGGALAFVFVQGAILHQWCFWCNATHVLGVTASVFGWLLLDRRWRFGFAGLAMVWSGLWCAQVLGHEEQLGGLSIGTLESLKGEMVRFSEGRVTLPEGRSFAVGDLPHAGNFDSGKLVIALTDYLCPHCQRVHKTLKGLLEQCDGQFGVLWLPAFNSEEGGRVQGLMLALFRANPDVYSQISGDLWGGKLVASELSVRNAIGERLGNKLASLEKHVPWVETMLAQTREVVLSNKKVVATTNLPQLMLSDQILVGDGGRTGNLEVTLQEKLGLTSVKESQMHLVRDHFDVGVVRAGSNLPLEVAFKNSGSAVLRMEGMEDVESSRAAFGAPGEWTPGEEATIALVVPAPSQAGAFSKEYRLLTNSRKLPVITVSGVASSDWKQSVEALDFGIWEMGKGKPSPQSIELDFETPVTLKSPEIGKFLDVRTEVLTTMKRFKVTVALPEALEPGKHRLTLTIPLAPGVNIRTGEELPLPATLPAEIAVPVAIIVR